MWKYTYKMNLEIYSYMYFPRIIMLYYTDIDRDGHEISRFGGLLRELYFPEVRSTEGKYCPEGKYNYLDTTDT